MKFLPYSFCVLFFFSGFDTPLSAQSITKLAQAEDQALLPEFNWLPYAFYTESFGLGVGIGGAVSSWPAEETTVLGDITLGTTGSYTIAASISQLRIPGTKRLYMTPFFMGRRYQDQILYNGSNNPGFEGERAGSNDSSPDNFLLADQWDNQFEIMFSYLLPIGDGAGDEVVNTYIVEYGILKKGATGGKSIHPMKSGRTSILITPEWREQTLKQQDQEVPLNTTNVSYGLEWDNRDYPSNPASGSYFLFEYQKDYQSDGALSGWEAVAGEFEKIFDIGSSENTRQRVIAVDFSTNFVLNWEEDAEGNPTRRPPQYEAATLGGLYRMRGYEDSRFHDRAAVYYSLEYRVIPVWQPLRKVEWLSFAQIQYWQWILFAEAGRVSGQYDSELFYKDLHYDGGLSLRGMLHTSVLRLDVAISEEGSRVVAMYGHPF